MKANIRDKNKCGIYCIINKINGKKYVGKAKDIYKRIIEHITQLNNENIDENRHLINAWKKYGRENFEYFVIEYLELNENLLKEKELYWQLKHKVTNRNFGYNFRLDSSTKMITHEETKKLISERLKKEWKNGVRKNHGKKLSDNWKTTPERNKKQSEIMSNNLTKYTYNLYTKDNIFIENCLYKRLKELKLNNVLATFKRENINKKLFKNYIIERINN
jgi:group I intron endonuclease